LGVFSLLFFFLFSNFSCSLSYACPPFPSPSMRLQMLFPFPSIGFDLPRSFSRCPFVRFFHFCYDSSPPHLLNSFFFPRTPGLVSTKIPESWRCSRRIFWPVFLAAEMYFPSSSKLASSLFLAFPPPAIQLRCHHLRCYSLNFFISRIFPRSSGSNYRRFLVSFPPSSFLFELRRALFFSPFDRFLPPFCPHTPFRMFSKSGRLALSFLFFFFSFPKLCFLGDLSHGHLSCYGPALFFPFYSANCKVLWSVKIDKVFFFRYAFWLSPSSKLFFDTYFSRFFLLVSSGVDGCPGSLSGLGALSDPDYVKSAFYSSLSSLFWRDWNSSWKVFSSPITFFELRARDFFQFPLHAPLPFTFLYPFRDLNIRSHFSR